MSTQDEEFLRRLRATFEIEAGEHLHAIASGLLALEKPESEAAQAACIETIYREAHSLKGAARAVDMGDVETVCQSMETIFAAWKKKLSRPDSNALDVLHKSLDVMRGLLRETNAGRRVQSRDAMVALLARVGTSPAPPAVHAAGIQPPPRNENPPPPPLGDTERPASDTVRISLAKLDSQLLRAEDLLPLKSLLAQRALELRELVMDLEQWRIRWDKMSAGARAQLAPAGGDAAASGELDAFFEWNSNFHRSLEQKLRSSAAQMDRDKYAAGKKLDELLEDSKKLLMLPFSTLASVFPKIIRDLCRSQAKEADLEIEGGDIEIDKRILEEMKDPFLHVLRNCIDHGIEAPAERALRHKPPRGRISFAVSQVNGSKVQIIISDDGGGIDLDALKQSAVRQNLLSATEAQALPDDKALALVFDSGVTTRQTATAVSGRGLGMAIVRSKVEALGGRIVLENRRHGGTTMRMTLPMTLATFRGILVKTAGRTFVVPAVNVERVLRLEPGQIRTVENRETISVENRILSLVRLEAVLELPPPPAPRDAALPLFAMILRVGGERIAFVVDEVLHEEEVLVKPFRKPLVRVRNIGGATILGSGKVIPTLNVEDLAKSACIFPAAPVRADTVSSINLSPKRILVVEDSITSRMLLKGILESAGYSVQVAVDGMDAFMQLREGAFDMVVSDVEMPRLNGLDLTARIRADRRLADLPVVLVTALESRAQRERGIDVGANAYIIKSSFDQSNLLEAVRRLA